SGLIYLRVPTWWPCRLQFYCNGHSWLARQLTAAGIGFTLADNAFLRIDDWERAQTLANGLSPDVLRRVLDRYAHQCCPVLDVFAQSYHWSFTPRIWCSARQPSSNPSINSFPGRPSSLSKPNTSPPSSATGSLPNSPKRSAVNSQRGSRGPASGIVSANPRSRSMTNSASCCAWRPPPTTSTLSSRTRRGTDGRARPPAPSPPSDRRSTASRTCVKSCSVATAVISNTSPVWTISLPASARSTRAPAAWRLKQQARGDG